MTDDGLPLLETICTGCGGFGSRTNPSEVCTACDGTGYVPTPAGRDVLAFVLRHTTAQNPRTRR